jgi:hypothetical protein
MALELPDPEEARRLVSAMRDRVRLYLPALCDDGRRAAISRSLDDTESDASIAMLATLMAVYDRIAQKS